MKQTNKQLKFAALAVFVAAIVFASSDAYFSSDQGGRVWTLKSGGEINVASGASLTVAGTAVDPSAYALLAGDADGQTIQGRTGANAARIEVGEGFLGSGTAALVSSGATPTIIGASSTIAQLAMTDESASIHVSSGAASMFAATSVTLNSAAIRLNTSQTPPTNANDTCAAGDFIPATGFIYFCVSTDTWQRVALATWP